MPAAGAGFINEKTHVTGSKPQQRHAFDRQRRYHHLSLFTGRECLALVVHDLHHREVGMQVSALAGQCTRKTR